MKLSELTNLSQSGPYFREQEPGLENGILAKIGEYSFDELNEKAPNRWGRYMQILI